MCEDTMLLKFYCLKKRNKIETKRTLEFADVKNQIKSNIKNCLKFF